MELKQLEYIVKIAEEGSITKRQKSCLSLNLA